MELLISTIYIPVSQPLLKRVGVFLKSTRVLCNYLITFKYS